MTKAERLELMQLAKLRAKVAKDEITARSAHVLSDVEDKLAERFRADRPIWREITARAEAAVKAADEEIAEMCRRMGVPEEFRPEIRCIWYSRGENGDEKRRKELRKVAEAQVDARSKQAKVEIDKVTATVLTELTAAGLTTDRANQFLNTMPSVDALLPSMELRELGVPDPQPAIAAGAVTVTAAGTDVTDNPAPVTVVTAETDKPSPVTSVTGSRCAGCGSAFKPSRADARYCSAACRQRAHRRRNGGVS
jgi:hypothetical protein